VTEILTTWIWAFSRLNLETMSLDSHTLLSFHSNLRFLSSARCLHTPYTDNFGYTPSWMKNQGFRLAKTRRTHMTKDGRLDGRRRFFYSKTTLRLWTSLFFVSSLRLSFVVGIKSFLFFFFFFFFY
jgi:hypothetical protein